MFIVFPCFFSLCLLRAAAEATRSTHLHLINVKGALNVWGLETIHSYCGRGTAEGQIDICSGGFKVSNLRHSNDTMAQLLKSEKKEESHKHHTPSLKSYTSIEKVLHKVVHSCNKNGKKNQTCVTPLWVKNKKTWASWDKDQSFLMLVRGGLTLLLSSLCTLHTQTAERCPVLGPTATNVLRGRQKPL